MTSEELTRVNGFKIYNEFGCVYFPGETDLTDLNLDDIVNIERHNIEIYNDNIKAPQYGQKLNRKATLTIYGCKPKYDHETESLVSTLKNMNESSGNEFVAYEESSGNWVFNVVKF
jgi:nuclear pore complex protein Nup98-Nup96